MAYLTTPIYYVNDRPHIGHVYTTLVADVAARADRLLSGAPESTFFLTGTDEHADKVVTSAAAHGMTAIQWADRNAAEFERAFKAMNLGYDDFIRTTQPRHTSRVIAYITALMKAGSIYKGTYEGWYDANQEEYLTETAAKDANYLSPVNGQPLIRRSETCYFFRLSAYADRLKKHFDAHPHFIRPDARRNEVLGRLRDGLQDVPISRPVTDDPATQFGIRVPGDDAHRIYVWIDALFNYLSVVDTPERRKFWPPRVHFLAKDILWFHAVVWPALLLALRESGPEWDWVKLPGSVYSHAYWVREGRKMSKSLGNFVTIEVLQAYADKYSRDAVRWYLLTQGPLGTTDADFSHAKFVEVYNADLANGLGNCASRVGNMIDKYFGGELPDPRGQADHAGHDWRVLQRDLAAQASAALREDDLSGYASSAVALIRAVDGYINQTAPFKLAKRLDTEPAVRDELGLILYHCAEAVRAAAVLMSAIIPEKTGALLGAWGASIPAGVPLEQLCAWGGPASLKPGQRVGKGEILFMRADPAEAPPA
jgi:methionyl-tRNA synthetase